VDHDGLLVRVIVEDHDFEQPAGSIGADDKVPSIAVNHAEGVADGVSDVLVADTVLTRAVRDLHEDKLALSRISVKVTLSTCPGAVKGTSRGVPGDVFTCGSTRLRARRRPAFGSR
jgi:hypothetical protein